MKTIYDLKLTIKEICLKIRRPKSRGFTVIELLIYIAIFAIVLTIALDLLFQSKTLEIQIAQNQEVDRNAQVALLEMTQTIHASQDVTSPAVGLSADNLSLDNGTIRYLVDANGVLQKDNNGELSDLTASTVRVENLSFTTRAEEGEKPTVSLSFSVKSKTRVYNQADYILRTYQTTLQLR